MEKQNNDLIKARSHLVKVAVQVNGRFGMYQSHRWKNPNAAFDILRRDLQKQGIKNPNAAEFVDKKDGKAKSQEEIISDYGKEGGGTTIQDFVKNKYEIKGSKAQATKQNESKKIKEVEQSKGRTASDKNLKPKGDSISITFNLQGELLNKKQELTKQSKIDKQIVAEKGLGNAVVNKEVKGLFRREHNNKLSNEKYKIIHVEKFGDPSLASKGYYQIHYSHRDNNDSSRYMSAMVMHDRDFNKQVEIASVQELKEMNDNIKKRKSAFTKLHAMKEGILSEFKESANQGEDTSFSKWQLEKINQALSKLQNDVTLSTKRNPDLDEFPNKIYDAIDEVSDETKQRTNDELLDFYNKEKSNNTQGETEENPNVYEHLDTILDQDKIKGLQDMLAPLYRRESGMNSPVKKFAAQYKLTNSLFRVNEHLKNAPNNEKKENLNIEMERLYNQLSTGQITLAQALISPQFKDCAYLMMLALLDEDVEQDISNLISTII